MKLLLRFAFILWVFVPFGLVAQQAQTGSMKIFIDALMKKMTLEEKLGQLNLPVAGDITTGQAANADIAKKIADGKVGGLFNIKSVAKIREVQKMAVEKSRLKIPLLFGMDVIHGYQTVFPIPLGLSCNWDMKAIEQSARIAATEASADGICWTFSPMVDVSRDPRWGRISEGNGEDAYLGAEIAKAMVKGYQGDNYEKNNTIMACVKHYALYGSAEAGRDYNTTDMSRVRMFNDYLPPYKAAVDAGVGSVMASFNEVDGIPATANKWLMTDVLRKQWGFKGMVVTDYTGINEMVDHGLGDLQEVAAKALKAGIDMDMVGESFLTTLKKSLQEGKVTQQQIDDACRTILEAKYKLGLFSDPYRFCDEKRAATEIFTSANRAIARKIAAESFVLLKNKGDVLPLKKAGRIALIGPLADATENMTGTWSVAADFTKSIPVLKGLTEAVGSNARVLYAKGCNLSSDSLFEERATMFGKTLHRDKRPANELLQEALAIATQSDVVVAALGESAEMTGESSSRSNIEIPQIQKDLLQALLKTGKPVVGFRTTTHAFNYPKGHPLEKWNSFGELAFNAPPGWGGKANHTHYGHESSTDVTIIPAQAKDPILTGVGNNFHARSWLYKVLPDYPSNGSTALLMGHSVNPNTPDAFDNPVAWTGKNSFGGKFFMTTLGHPEDFRLEPFQHLIINAIHWAAGKPIPEKWAGKIAIDVPYRQP